MRRNHKIDDMHFRESILLALVMILVSLYFITKTMRTLLADRVEEALNRVLGKRGILAIVIGAFTLGLGGVIAVVVLNLAIKPYSDVLNADRTATVGVQAFTWAAQVAQKKAEAAQRKADEAAKAAAQQS